MTEITRVPLQPIARGSLTKLWLGVLAALLIAAGIAWSAMPAQIRIETLKAGAGAKPAMGEIVFIKYTGTLADGTVFDKSPDQAFPIPGILPDGVPMEVGGTVPGFTDGLLQMQKGGRYKLHIPAAKAYGAKPPQGSMIPANSDLDFTVELVEIMPKQEAEQRVQYAQQMMQQVQQQMQAQQQGRGGRRGGAPVPPPGGLPPEAMPPGAVQP